MNTIHHSSKFEVTGPKKGTPNITILYNSVHILYVFNGLHNDHSSELKIPNSGVSTLIY